MCCKLIPGQYRKWLTLIGAFLIHLSLGSIYTFGNMNPYITSYLREFVGIDIRYSSSIWIYSATSIASCLSTVLTGLFISRFQPRLKIVIFFGCMLMNLSVALTYYTINMTFFATILTYGFLNGFGTGIAYLSPLSIVMKAFPEKRGFANSVVLFGYGASAIFFNQIETFFVNPENFPPDKPYSEFYPNEKYFSKLHPELLMRIPDLFLAIAAMYFVLQVLGIILIYEEDTSQTAKNFQKLNDDDLNNEEGRNSDLNSSREILTSSQNIQNYGTTEQTAPHIEVNSLGVRYENPDEGLTIKEAIFKKEFYFGTLMLALFKIAPSLIISFYKTYGLTFIHDDQYLAMIGSVSSIFNACGRLFWGFVIDRMPFKYCYLIISTFVIGFIGTISFIQIKEVYLLWVCVILFMQCGIFVITPTTMAKCFGQKHFTSIYGLMYLLCIPASFTAALLGPYCDEIGWFWFFFIGCSISFFGWILALFFDVKKSNGKLI